MKISFCPRFNVRGLMFNEGSFEEGKNRETAFFERDLNKNICITGDDHE